MTIKEFAELSLDGIADITKMDKTRWSKYFNGAGMSEIVINEMAKRLEMQPHTFLEALNIRRLHNSATSANLKSVA